jgi:hypothetical protein
MQKVKERWTELDNEIRLHYAALRQARELAGILPVTETPHPTHLPEPGAAPSFKLPAAPLPSSRDRSQVREIGMMPAPAPISSRPAPQQSEFVSDDAGAAEGSLVEHDSSQREEEMSGGPVEAQSVELIRVLDSDEVLGRLDEANAALDAANSLEAVKEIADNAAAAHLYARRAKRGKEAENKAAAYFCRASAKLGRMIAEGRRTKRIQIGRPKKRVQKVPISESANSANEKRMTLTELGLDKRAAAQARKLAKYTPNDFETRLKKKLDKLELSRTSTLEDPKQKDPKPVTRQNCVKALSKLLEVLADCGDESFDVAFLRSQKLDLDKCRATWPKLMTLMQAARDFIQTPSQPQQP